MFLYYSLWVILVPGIIISLWAQIKFNKAINTFSKIKNEKGITGSQIARRLLDNSAARDVSLKSTSVTLSDHYNPRKKEIVLSSGIYNGDTLAAVGVAAHEVGHAVQHAEKSALMKVWKTVGILANVSSKLLWPIVAMGLIFGFFQISGAVGNFFAYAGIVFFGITFLYSLAKLPLEKDASKRALVMLEGTGNFDEVELAGAKKVLDAAALTYFAASLTSLLYLLRFALVIMSSRRR